MDAHEVHPAAEIGCFPAEIDDRPVRRLAIGDRVRGLTEGIVVDLESDAVVVARRNDQGRCMEVVFVGDAAKMLRPA